MTEKQIRASEVMVAAAPQLEGLTDAGINTSCPSCRKVFTLAACSFYPSPEPAYRCQHCQSVVLTIGKPGCGRGYRLGDHVIVNETDIVVGNGVSFPASRPSLDKLS